MRSSAFAYLLAGAICSSLLSSCTHRLILSDLPHNFPEAGKRLPQISKRIVDTAKDISTIASSSGQQVWFVRTADGKMELVSATRRLSGESKVEAAVKALLEGPDPNEMADGMGSEIPRGTILLSVSETEEGIAINLSRRFASDGGTDSFEARMEQLSRTIAAVESVKPVYLDIEGHRLTMTQGEGIEVKQPINR